MHPHVARAVRSDANAIDGSEYAPELQAVLEGIGPRCGHPGWALPYAIDSIGKDLSPDSVRAEEYRGALFDFTGPMRVGITRHSYDLLTTAEADALPSDTRFECVAVQGRDQLLLSCENTTRSLATVEVSFEDGTDASVVLKENMDPRVVTAIVTSTNGKRKQVTACFVDESVSVLSALFRPEALRASAFLPYQEEMRRVGSGDFVRHMLPDWLTEHVATLLQDVFRLHVLCSAVAPPPASRPLLVDHAWMCDLKGTQEHTPHTMMRVVLHPSCGRCLCCVSGDSPSTAPRQVVADLHFCGQEIRRGNGDDYCVHHYERNEQSARFPGMCCLHPWATLKCEHAEKQQRRLTLPVDLCAKPFVEVLACAVRLRQAVSSDQVESLKTSMEAAMAEFDRTFSAPLMADDAKALTKLRGKHLNLGACGTGGKRYKHLFKDFK